MSYEAFDFRGPIDEEWLAEHFLAINATKISEMRGVVLRVGESAIRTVEWRQARQLVSDPSFLGAHRRAARAHLQMLDME
ncbi:MAG TPA: hypothetical protein VFT16_02295 [Candidatus Saccharimonadales bacterium]|nr:hypothetical protein [Candidatus Saccharimonadales bacterium]